MNQVGNNQSGRLLSIGQVTALTGIGRSTLRHWEREFRDFLESVRTQGNQRRFTPDAVGKIEQIKTLVEEQGLTLRGVRRKLEETQLQKQQDETKSDPAPGENLRLLVDLMSEHLMRRLFHDSEVGNN